MREIPEMPNMRMIWCPAGSFLMGATEAEKTEDAEEKEYPQHEVTITRGFWMGETPVTQAQFVSLMGYQPSHFDGERRPVERVSWHEAAAFCNALSRHLGDPAVFVEREREHAWEVECEIEKRWQSRRYYEALGFRLATEAEWEYACRAGSTAPRYAEIKRCAWYWNNADRQTQEVAQKQPNAWGLYDMLGNVWEWCYDAPSRSYTAQAACDPICDGEDLRGGLDGEEVVRVVRGGSWYSAKDVCRAAYRFDDVMFLRDDAIGFRVVRGVDGADRWR
jgi:formylglycine-generating enzyme required for sulfatase activity